VRASATRTKLPSTAGLGGTLRRGSAVLCFAALAIASGAHAQVFTNKVVGEKNAAYADSLKKSVYPYALPIWGDKATKRGYDLPYSAGLSMQYFGQRSDIVIENLQRRVQRRHDARSRTASCASTRRSRRATASRCGPTSGSTRS
jgi:hypothetical protein